VTGTTGSGLRTIALPGGDVAQLRQLTSLTDNFCGAPAQKRDSNQRRFRHSAVDLPAFFVKRIDLRHSHHVPAIQQRLQRRQRAFATGILSRTSVAPVARSAGFAKREAMAVTSYRQLVCYRLIDPTIRFDEAGLMEGRPSWLGRVAPSKPRSRPAARPCAGLDGAGAYVPRHHDLWHHPLRPPRQHYGSSRHRPASDA
jgi:hypothetical protein